MYAIVKTGGKQYRVEEGQSLLVERLPADDGAKVGLEPLLYVDGSSVVDGEDLAKVKVEARVVGHERGPKLRIVKFKPKRGYKRRTGHRQELTRLEVDAVSSQRGEAGGAEAAKPAAAKPAASKAAEAGGEQTEAAKPAAKPRARKPAAKPKPPARKPRTTKPKKEDDDGS